jgi:hypothetical protein
MSLAICISLDFQKQVEKRQRLPFFREEINWTLGTRSF